MTKDLVVIVPGISGSVLGKNGQTAWGVSAGAIWRGIVSGGLDGLQVTDETGSDELGDGVTVEGIMPDVHMIPGLWKIDGYTGFGVNLAARMGRAISDGIVYFPYDWRRDNRVSARAFAKRILPALRDWRQKVGNDAKLTIIAHSMGGLVSRYFIECLEGWKDTRQLITFGTPFRGSLNAVGFLSNGFAKKIGPLTIDATSVLRSVSSVYQLLPTYECVDAGDGVLRAVDQVAIPGLDAKRVQDARRFHEEIAMAAAKNREIEGFKTVTVTPLLSSTQPTFQSGKVKGTGVELLMVRGGKDEGGDGTVPMVSAIMQTMQTTDGFFVKGIHGSLQATDAALEFSVGQLSAADVSLDRLRSTDEGGTISFALDDAYPQGLLPLRAAVADVTERKLTAEAAHAETGEKVQTTLWPDTDGVFKSDNLTLSEGIWRVTVAGERSKPVTDIALVVAGTAA